jgi:hypothetical protein
LRCKVKEKNESCRRDEHSIYKQSSLLLLHKEEKAVKIQVIAFRNPSPLFRLNV